MTSILLTLHFSFSWVLDLRSNLDTIEVVSIYTCDIAFC